MDLFIKTDGTAHWGARRMRCAIGRSGIVRYKREGDGATPAGVHSLLRVLYRPDRIVPPNTNLVLAALFPDDGWCNASKDASYNQQVRLPAGVSLSQASNRPISPDLDIRGLRVEEAEHRLEEFLDQAGVRGLSSVKVSHGGATGSLRSMVRERLKNHPLVKTSRPQGSTRTDGATQVELN